MNRYVFDTGSVIYQVMSHSTAQALDALKEYCWKLDIRYCKELIAVFGYPKDPDIPNALFFKDKVVEFNHINELIYRGDICDNVLRYEMFTNYPHKIKIYGENVVTGANSIYE